jgi:hypothetical protein
MPKHDIDHINQIKTDNRIANLRDVTDSQNHMNTKAPSSNTSGYKGVTFHKETGKWMAHAMLNGKSSYGGLHHTKEEANEAAIRLRKTLHGEFATN